MVHKNLNREKECVEHEKVQGTDILQQAYSYIHFS